MVKGDAPVSAHEIYTNLATAIAGVRPRPAGAGKSEMIGLPVTVWCTSDGKNVAMPLTGWILLPHLAARIESEDVAGLPEQPGELRFLVAVPDGWTLAKTEAPRQVGVDLASGPDKTVEVPWTQDGAAGHVPDPNDAFGRFTEYVRENPDIIATDPERRSARIRELNRKAANPAADGGN